MLDSALLLDPQSEIWKKIHMAEQIIWLIFRLAKFMQELKNVAEIWWILQFFH